MKGTIRYIAYSVIYTARIHANALCRLRFMAIKAVAKPDYWPAHHKWCPTCKYRCLQRAGVYERAREGWAKHGTYILSEEKYRINKMNWRSGNDV